MPVEAWKQLRLGFFFKICLVALMLWQLSLFSTVWPALTCGWSAKNFLHGTTANGHLLRRDRRHLVETIHFSPVVALPFVVV